jgi:hypothetical protein
MGSCSTQRSCTSTARDDDRRTRISGQPQQYILPRVPHKSGAPADLRTKAARSHLRRVNM